MGSLQAIGSNVLQLGHQINLLTSQQPPLVYLLRHVNAVFSVSCVSTVVSPNTTLPPAQLCRKDQITTERGHLGEPDFLKFQLP